jgi:hypothetical protein
MSSNLFSTVSNYSGRQPDNQQGIKQYVSTIKYPILWVYKKLNSLGETLITPSDSTKTVYINNNLIVSGSINSTSDCNLKDNIKDISNNLKNNILNLNPVEFVYKNDNKQIHYGLIAQDVEKIYPNLVSNISGYKTVNYIELIPLLLSKIQNMQEEINELKYKINK